MRQYAEQNTELEPGVEPPMPGELPAAHDGALPRVGSSDKNVDRRVTHGHLRSTLLWLALPVLFEQFLNFCVGTCDMWLAGHLPDSALTVSATSAIGVAAYVGWLASMVFSLVAAGTTALVARHWGAGEADHASRITNRSLALALVAGLAFLTFIWPAAPLFPWLLGLDPVASDITVQYLRLDGVGLVFTALSLVGAAALRGAGDMRTPMAVLGTVSVVNLIVSPALVYGIGPVPSIGVSGIVAGTVVARMAGGMLMLVCLASRRSRLSIRPRELRVTGGTARRILRIGVPAAFDGAVLWAGHFVFLRIISGIGPTALAAHMVGIRVEAITYLPAVAWGAAAATMVGQALGNSDPRRASRAGHEAVLQCGMLGILITATFFFGADAIYRLMNNSGAVVEMGVPAFRLLALFQIPLIVGIVYAASLRGAGDTRFPLLMTILSTFCLRLPLAWLLGVHLGLGLVGAWLGMCSDMLTRSILAAARFARGRWMRIEV
jgi:putative MATE family efflux protein